MHACRSTLEDPTLFHLRLNIRGPDAGQSDPDPVDQLTERYAEWRAARAGRPDGLLSTVEGDASLPADGVTKRWVTVRLVDLDGVPLTHGGAKVQVASADGARLNAVLGAVIDLGDGSYRFSISATRRVGTDRLAITAEDELVRATLYPFLEVRSETPPALHLGRDELSAGRGGALDFVLNRPESARAGYVLTCGVSATGHGFAVARGALDDGGRAEVALRVPPEALSALIGTRLRWQAWFAGASGLTASEVVALALVP